VPRRGQCARRRCAADALLEHIESRGAPAVILAKRNRKVQRYLDCYHYRYRNMIERLFAWLKQFRRIAARYDKLGTHFLSFVILAASMLWLN